MDQNLEQRILKDNPSWLDPSYRSELAQYPKREQFSNLEELLADRMMLSLVGLRRTGKSTLMFQLLEQVQNTICNPKQILFFSFDEKLQASTPAALEEILHYYFNSVLNTSPRLLKERVYIFIDEIQYVEYWQAILKNYYDSSLHIKFIVSGSFSLKLINQDRESLAGRIFETYIPPLSFSEYLKIKYRQDSVAKISLSNLDPDLFKSLDYKSFISKHTSDFEDFILAGNFPETITMNDVDKKFTYIENSIINKLIENDIPKIYKINKQDELKTLANCLIQDSSSIYEVKNLAEATGIHRNTISKYIEALESSFFMDTVLSTHRSYHKARKTHKKAYVISPNFTAALLNLKIDNPLLSQFLGKLVETYIYQRLKENKKFKNIHFFRKGKNEIDFLAGDFLPQHKSELSYIEVKYQNKIQSSDIKFLLKYLKEHELKKGLVISKNRFEVQNYDGIEICFVPAMLI